jgi:hypothetical protein
LISARISYLKQSKPREYFQRFVFGGAATVLDGIVAKHFGPGPGGLFLAFPAIFPATVTLIEAHSKQRMAKIGYDGRNRGRMAASIDAAGAALGSVGLAGFAVVLWLMLPNHSALLSLFTGLLVWAALSVILWEIRRNRIFGLRVRALR